MLTTSRPRHLLAATAVGLLTGCAIGSATATEATPTGTTATTMPVVCWEDGSCSDDTPAEEIAREMVNAVTGPTNGSDPWLCEYEAGGTWADDVCTLPDGTQLDAFGYPIG